MELAGPLSRYKPPTEPLALILPKSCRTHTFGSSNGWFEIGATFVEVHLATQQLNLQLTVSLAIGYFHSLFRASYNLCIELQALQVPLPASKKHDWKAKKYHLQRLLRKKRSGAVLLGIRALLRRFTACTRGGCTRSACAWSTMLRRRKTWRRKPSCNCFAKLGLFGENQLSRRGCIASLSTSF